MELKSLGLFQMKGLRGYLRVTSAGDLVVDRCATGAEHLLAPVGPGGERRECQRHVADIFRPFLGKKGVVLLTLQFIEDET